MYPTDSIRALGPRLGGVLLSFSRQPRMTCGLIFRIHAHFKADGVAACVLRGQVSLYRIMVLVTPLWSSLFPQCSNLSLRLGNKMRSSPSSWSTSSSPRCFVLQGHSKVLGLCGAKGLKIFGFESWNTAQRRWFLGQNPCFNNPVS